MAVLTEFPNWMMEDATGQFEMRTMPNPVLRETAERVDKHEFGPELKAFCDRMITFMHASKGVGLAAPQIGLLKRIFIMDTDSGPEIVINPILTPGRGVVGGQEACLSVSTFAVRHHAEYSAPYSIFRLSLPKNRVWRDRSMTCSRYAPPQSELRRHGCSMRTTWSSRNGADRRPTPYSFDTVSFTKAGT